MIGQFKGRQKTNVYGWVSDLAVARSGFNQIANSVNPDQVYRPLVKSAYQKNNFLISQPKHMLWVLKRTVSMRRFF